MEGNEAMYQQVYTITDQLLAVIAEIERHRAKVQASVILPEREIELRYRATVEATHSSTSIEGNPLSRKQVEAVISSKERLTRNQYAQRILSAAPHAARNANDLSFVCVIPITHSSGIPFFQ